MEQEHGEKRTRLAPAQGNLAAFVPHLEVKERQPTANRTKKVGAFAVAAAIGPCNTAGWVAQAVFGPGVVATCQSSQPDGAGQH
jgi:hypothetical protein